MKKILLTLLIGMFLISIVSAQSTYKQSNELDLKVPCFYSDTRCSDTAECNLSILYPNSSFLVEEQPMTNLENGYHNYTLNESQTSVLGEHPVSVYCIDNSEKGYSTFAYRITPTGQEITMSQGIVSIGLIFMIMLLIGLFVFLAFIFQKSEQLFPLALFFILVSCILGVYSLHLGYLFSRDILYPLAIESTQFAVYLGVMWGLVAIGFIGMVFLTVKALKEFRERKSIQKHGEGWDPKDRIYK